MWTVQRYTSYYDDDDCDSSDDDNNDAVGDVIDNSNYDVEDYRKTTISAVIIIIIIFIITIYTIIVYTVLKRISSSEPTEKGAEGDGKKEKGADKGRE